VRIQDNTIRTAGVDYPLLLHNLKRMAMLGYWMMYLFNPLAFYQTFFLLGLGDY
jgi:hypothetical protein